MKEKKKNFIDNIYQRKGWNYVMSASHDSESCFSYTTQFPRYQYGTGNQKQNTKHSIPIPQQTCVNLPLFSVCSEEPNQSAEPTPGQLLQQPPPTRTKLKRMRETFANLRAPDDDASSLTDYESEKLSFIDFDISFEDDFALMPSLPFVEESSTFNRHDISNNDYDIIVFFILVFFFYYMSLHIEVIVFLLIILAQISYAGWTWTLK